MWFYNQCHEIPKEITDTLAKILNSFIWSTKTSHKISTSSQACLRKDEACQLYNKGGVKILELNNEMRAFRAKWVSRLIDCETKGAWKDYVIAELEESANKAKIPFTHWSQLLTGRLNEKQKYKLANALPPPWNNSIKAWHTMKPVWADHRHISKESILSMPWVHSPYTKNPDMRTMQKLKTNKIGFLHELWDNKNNRWLDLKECHEKECMLTEIQYNKLMEIIPEEWNQKLNEPFSLTKGVHISWMGTKYQVEGLTSENESSRRRVGTTDRDPILVDNILVRKTSSIGTPIYPNTIPNKNYTVFVSGNKHDYTKSIDWSRATLHHPTELMPFHTLTVKQIYWHITIKPKHKLPRISKLIQKYTTKYHNKQIHWPSIFKFMHNPNLDPQQKSVKWRVIREAMITGKWEEKKYKTDSQCDLCKCPLEVHHAFAKCPKVAAFWVKVHDLARKLGIEPRQNRQIPWEWAIITGVRDYTLDGPIEDVCLWQSIHATAMQVINRKFWKFKIDKSNYNSITVWGEFCCNLNSNLHRQHEVAKRQDYTVRLHYMKKGWKLPNDKDPNLQLTNFKHGYGIITYD